MKSVMVITLVAWERSGTHNVFAVMPVVCQFARKRCFIHVSIHFFHLKLLLFVQDYKIAGERKTLTRKFSFLCQGRVNIIGLATKNYTILDVMFVSTL